MAFRIGNTLKHTVSTVSRSRQTSSLMDGQVVRRMSSKLVVEGLSGRTDDSSLHQTFSPHGEIVEATIIRNDLTQRSRGYGFVTFELDEDAQSARHALNGQVLGGNIMSVDVVSIPEVEPNELFDYVASSGGRFLALHVGKYKVGIAVSAPDNLSVVPMDIPKGDVANSDLPDFILKRYSKDLKEKKSRPFLHDIITKYNITGIVVGISFDFGGKIEKDTRKTVLSFIEALQIDDKFSRLKHCIWRENGATKVVQFVVESVPEAYRREIGNLVAGEILMDFIDSHRVVQDRVG